MVQKKYTYEELNKQHKDGIKAGRYEVVSAIIGFLSSEFSHEFDMCIRDLDFIPTSEAYDYVAEQQDYCRR